MSSPRGMYSKEDAIYIYNSSIPSKKYWKLTIVTIPLGQNLKDNRNLLQSCYFSDVRIDNVPNAVRRVIFLALICQFCDRICN